MRKTLYCRKRNNGGNVLKRCQHTICMEAQILQYIHDERKHAPWNALDFRSTMK